MFATKDKNKIRIKITLEGRNLSKVSVFKYVGSRIPSSEDDINHRIALAWHAYWQLSRIWRSDLLTTKIKTDTLRASVISVLSYGCESWVISKKLEQQINCFGNKCYRGIIAVSMFDRISNEDLYERVELPLMIEIIRKRQLTWLGHALPRENDEIAKVFALFIPENDLRVDKRGAPKLSYREYILKVLRTCSNVESPGELERLASDRVRWWDIVAACCKTVE